MKALVQHLTSFLWSEPWSYRSKHSWVSNEDVNFLISAQHRCNRHSGERHCLWWRVSEKQWGPKPHFMCGFICPKTLFSSPKLNTVCFPALCLPLSAESSLVAWATHRPLIWLLSHWCIDAGEPVSLHVALFTTHCLSHNHSLFLL